MTLLPTFAPTFTPTLRGISAAAIAASAAFAMFWHAPAHAEEAAKDFSVAERLLFMSSQLKGIKLPTTLNYSFRKSGSMEEGFDDKVGVSFGPQPDGKCCAGKGSFLSGSRAVPMPDVEGGEGNPVTMYFLEHDVREMQRLTKGSQTYFRKRIRMAIFNGATVRDVSLPYKGRAVDGKEITITPYRDDPNSQKFEKLLGKTYQFLLSDAVPGSVYAIRTRVDAAAPDGKPLLLEEMLLDGAERCTTTSPRLDCR